MFVDLLSKNVLPMLFTATRITLGLLSVMLLITGCYLLFATQKANFKKMVTNYVMADISVISLTLVCYLVAGVFGISIKQILGFDPIKDVFQFSNVVFSISNLLNIGLLFVILEQKNE
ncbi:hypothetical protein [Lactobacillus crispatus]|uniref:hypothetical protein n=1 Tax=Lactobacillus crispatus TaxID=47770 RepID=UPI00105FC0CF|nr:hypothetical protein [Lactobacillus crispatus]TDN09474.1 hypothetical protein CEE83_11525 [Lactobacillus crispatus]